MVDDKFTWPVARSRLVWHLLCCGFSVFIMFTYFNEDLGIYPFCCGFCNENNDSQIVVMNTCLIFQACKRNCKKFLNFWSQQLEIQYSKHFMRKKWTVVQLMVFVGCLIEPLYHERRCGILSQLISSLPSGFACRLAWILCANKIINYQNIWKALYLEWNWTEAEPTGNHFNVAVQIRNNDMMRLVTSSPLKRPRT
jgi:hypothetical protein